MYTHIPGFAVASEWCYDFLARRRGLLNRISKLLWGPALEPERYELVSWVFLRLLGAIYVAAFASLGVQILGLVGHAGILPLGDHLGAAWQALGNTAYWVFPTLFWMDSSDALLLGRVTYEGFAEAWPEKLRCVGKGKVRAHARNSFRHG